MGSEYIGHLDGERVQTLEAHLSGVAALACEFGKAFGAEHEAKLLGENHDDGKFSEAFQQYIRGLRKGRVDHSTAGAQILGRQKKLGPLATLGAFCIAGHHAGLPDLGTKAAEAGEASLQGRLKKELPDFEMVKRHSSLDEPIDAKNLCRMYKDNLDAMLLTRMLFSCLVDADFLDTEAFMKPEAPQRGKFPPIDALHELFFSKLNEQGYFSPKSEINTMRTKILRTCMEKGKGGPGLYSLTVPTGGGKTISSLAFALEHAKEHKKTRIIYVIPYLSIIDQTAQIFKDFLGEEAVLESHSNVNYDAYGKESDLAERMKLATENWDAPVIITTSEQFWESLYANRTSKCRKLHNIVNSVIIFDEAQMLPVDFLKPCLKALTALTDYYRCTAVLCSATQPELGRYMGRPAAEIMEDIPALYRFFRRVTFRTDGEKSYEALAEEIGKESEALCIASTKKEAREIFECINGAEKLYLSTDLCPAHRMKLIEEIRRRLKEKKECRVISTSIISVGVDVDFPVAYLEYSGLDSLIQGAGRCNREGKRAAEESVAHIFWTEKGKKSPFMKEEKKVTDLLRNTYTDAELTEPEAISAYFENWYRCKEGDLDYKDIEERAGRWAFAEIGKAFKLIRDSTKSVFIPYDDTARDILRELQRGVRSRELMRRAGRYIVNVRYSADHQKESPFSLLLRQGQIEMLPDDEELAFLTDEKAYDPKLGLLIEEQSGEGICW